MPDMIQLGIPAVDVQIRQYFTDIEALSQRAVAGKIADQAYRVELERLTRQALTLAFVLSGGDISTTVAVAALKTYLDQAARSARILTDDLYDGRYTAVSADDAKPGRPEQTAERGLEKLTNRLNLWTFTMAGVYHLGQEYAQEQQRFTWRLGLTEQHCTTCAGLDGVTLTAAEWQQLGHRPQGDTLECGGWYCDCRREPTNKASDGLASVNV